VRLSEFLDYPGLKMELVRLKDKGQITIPVSIREEIAAQVGDLFAIEVDEGRIVLKAQDINSRPAATQPEKVAARTFASWIGSAKGVFASVAEVDEYIRAERSQWD
jgi:AbrB family looped-hinge helix DNA binding protein